MSAQLEQLLNRIVSAIEKLEREHNKAMEGIIILKDGPSALNPDRFSVSLDLPRKDEIEKAVRSLDGRGGSDE